MTPEEKRQYDKDYRKYGFGRHADKRYRLKHLAEIRAKDRERKRRKRK